MSFQGRGFCTQLQSVTVQGMVNKPPPDGRESTALAGLTSSEVETLQTDWGLNHVSTKQQPEWKKIAWRSEKFLTQPGILHVIHY